MLRVVAKTERPGREAELASVPENGASRNATHCRGVVRVVDVSHHLKQSLRSSFGLALEARQKDQLRGWCTGWSPATAIAREGLQGVHQESVNKQDKFFTVFGFRLRGFCLNKAGVGDKT